MDETNSTSQRIYQCTHRILETEGPQAVSKRRVGKEAGITAIALYITFLTVKPCCMPWLIRNSSPWLKFSPNRMENSASRYG
jgi:hypothetical protein